MKVSKQPTGAFARRQVYIKKGFQARFIFRFVLVLIAGGAISIGLTLFNTQGTLTSSFTDSRLVIQNTSLAIMPSVILTTLITTLVVGIIVIAVTLFASHKLAGPMYRFEKDIARVTSGDLKNRIRIRKGDQFQEMADALNTMIDTLNNNISYIESEVADLADNPDLPEDCRAAVAGLNLKIRSRFTL